MARYQAYRSRSNWVFSQTPPIFLRMLGAYIGRLLSSPGLTPYRSSKRFVLRKKPAGQLLSTTAHQIEREYTMLSALHKHNTKPSTVPEKCVPVPIPYALCEDSSVVGTPFYIMEYLDGRIFTDARMPEVLPSTRREWCVPLLKV